MSLAVRLSFEPLRSLAFGSISGTYTRVGTPTLFPSRLVLIQNFTDKLMVFSWDGISDHFVIPANGYVIFDFTANRTVAPGAFLAQNSQLYVNDAGSAPTVGSVYFSTVYGSNDSVT